MKRILLLAILSMNILQAFGCLILFITDGKQVMVANHEDWYAQDAEVTFIPASGKKMGMLFFDFASEGTAQGGMNTAGLFFDGTATPEASFPGNDSKKDCHCYIWTKILEECTTVEQAISYVMQYKIPEIEKIHILFADAKGHSAIIGVYDGKLQIHRNDGKRYQLLTNFNITNPSYGGEPVCTRFATAEKMLQHDSSATIENLRAILSKTHQGNLTVYSNIYNLTTKEVYVYSKIDFEHTVKINLFKELAKGKRAVALTELLKHSP
jgi:penicillin V acylase-like amidase (Ntn superfamily)